MKKIFILVAATIASLSVNAQDRGHYLYGNVGGGYNTIQYSPENGKWSGGYGYTANLGYNYFFTKNWGVGTGVGISKLAASSLFNFRDIENYVDAENSSFDYEYRVQYNDWKELQNMMVLDVPVGLWYQKGITGGCKFLLGFGGKIEMPLSSKYETEGEFETRKYYPIYNVEYYTGKQDMSHHGCYTYAGEETGSVTQNKIGAAAFVDLGLACQLNQRLELRFGLYANYGLTNLIASNKKHMVSVETPSTHVYQGVLASNQVDKANTFSAGFKIGLAWHWGGDAPEIEDIPTPENIPDSTIEEINKNSTAPVPTNNNGNTSISIHGNDNKVVIGGGGSGSGSDGSIGGAALSGDGGGIGNAETVGNGGGGESPAEDNDGVVDSEAPKKMSSQVVKHTRTLSDAETLFSIGSAKPRIDAATNEWLREMSKILKENPDAHIRVTGHTCDMGGDDYNYNLGMKRAISARNELLALGVSPEQIEVSSKGESEPVAPNTNGDNRAKNRRTEFEMLVDEVDLTETEEKLIEVQPDQVIDDNTPVSTEVDTPDHVEGEVGGNE